MKPKLKAVLRANVLIFSIVALVHLLRVILGKEWILGTWVIPPILSIVLFIIAGYLAYANNLHTK